MVKKILIGFLILIVVLLAAVAAIPFFFKDEIVAKVKEVANENLNAKVDFGDFDISIFSTFPNFKLDIEKLSVIGKGAFDKDTIVYVDELNLELDINSVLDGKKYKVNSFEADGMVLNALWTKDGKNFTLTDVMLPDTAATPEPVEPEEAGDPFAMVFEKYALNNARIVYDDPSIPYRMELTNMNHSGSYTLDGDQHIMSTKTDMEALTVDFDGVSYIKKAKTNITADLIMDLATWKFTFKNNEFNFNNVALGLDGWFSMPDEGFGMDLKFNAKRTEFKDLFTMIPAVYREDMKDVKTTGKFEMNGHLKGMFTDSLMPAFGFNLKVINSSFRYPSVPKAVNNINIDLAINNLDGVFDHTVIDLNKLHAELGQYPIDMDMHIKTPESDAAIKGNIKAMLKLDVIGEVMPLEKGEEYHGTVNAVIGLKGRYSAIEREEYDKFDAHGTLELTDIQYKAAGMPDVLITKAVLAFAPQFLDLSTFESKIGNSDLSMKGKIENYLAYYLRDETLKGNFVISSTFFDVNQFMSEGPADTAATATTASADTASSGAVEIPKNIDFVLTSDLKRIKYDTYDITNFGGQLIMKDGVLKFVNNSFKLLDADFKLSGQYHALDIKKPYADLKFEVKNLDIPKAYANFNTIKKLAPICENTEGKLNLILDVKNNFTPNMDVDYNSIDGKGTLFIQQAKVKESKFTKGLAAAVKNDKFNNLELKDLKIYFTIAKGKLNVQPFDLKISKSKAKVNGWNSLDGKMDYTMATSVSRDEFGGAANAQAAQLMGALNQKVGANMQLPQFIDLDVKITGDVTNPKFAVYPKGTSGDAGQSVKDQVKDVLLDKAKDEAEKLKQQAEEEARKKADELKATALAEVDKQKKIVEEKVKVEADKLKKDAADKAKNALKGLKF